ncbi:MAG TPA: hypothetical protein VI757_13335 [Bacteroidia bacterium]|nr:hypothetical protein [Bacteroidia bacterium]
MTTITIRTSAAYGQRLYRKLKADRNLTADIKEEKSAQGKKNTTEIELVLPGSPLSDERLLQTLVNASQGRSITLSSARKRTLSKIASWRKRK